MACWADGDVNGGGAIPAGPTPTANVPRDGVSREGPAPHSDGAIKSEGLRPLPLAPGISPSLPTEIRKHTKNNTQTFEFGPGGLAFAPPPLRPPRVSFFFLMERPAAIASELLSAVT